MILMQLIEYKLLHNKTNKIMISHKQLINIHKIIYVFKKKNEIKNI